jgi:hypothetical protein
MRQSLKTQRDPGEEDCFEPVDDQDFLWESESRTPRGAEIRRGADNETGERAVF